MAINRKEFVRTPTAGGFIYTWTPETDLTKKVAQDRVSKTGCDAYPNTQGSDFDTTYVYEVVNNGGVLSRLAYVACDYVE